MKVIFLDIDGVLVTRSHLMSLDASGEQITDENNHHLFDPKCVENLKRIVDATGAKIVLSSCWKMFGWDAFTALWKERNCPSEIFDFTSSKLSATRGQEIKIWLNDHVGLVESFVIIDDDVFDFNDKLMPRVVQTTWEVGLTDDATDKALSILNWLEI